MRALAAFTFCCAAAMAADVTVPVPKTTLVPTTANSRPMMGADHTLGAMDLKKAGYVEEEFIVSGTANVYDWPADGVLNVKTANAPYATRILIRRPADPAKFSGTAIVELMNSARKFDWAMMWGFSHDYFMEHGDAWVGISGPNVTAGLQKFDPARYRTLSFANPTPNAPCGDAKDGSPTEEGLRWDAFSQVAAALKSPNGPLGRTPAQRVFLTAQIVEMPTYVNAIHSHMKLADGKRPFDGYMIKNTASAVKISQCAAAPPKGDPRLILHTVDVPIIAVVAQGEVIQSMAARHPDSDDPSGRYRLYEVAGAAHIDKFAYTALASFPDQIQAVGAAQGTPDWPFNAACGPPIKLSEHPLLKYTYDAAYSNLDAWVRKGTVPPKADRIQVKDGAVVLDQFGNGRGGVRSPYVDVPVAKYTTTVPGPGTCAELGEVLRFDDAHFKMLYGDRKTYANKFAQATDKMVKEHFLLESDAKRMKADLASAH